MVSTDHLKAVSLIGHMMAFTRDELAWPLPALASELALLPANPGHAGNGENTHSFISGVQRHGNSHMPVGWTHNQMHILAVLAHHFTGRLPNVKPRDAAVTNTHPEPAPSP